MILLFLASFFTFHSGTTSSLSSPAVDSLIWHTQFDQAQTLAQESNRHLLLVFSGSDWCRPCMKLQTELFETDAFRAYANEHLVLVKVDFPRGRKRQLPPEQQAHNSHLAEQYNPQGAFPYLVLLQADGTPMSQMGYLPGGPQAYLEYWQSNNDSK